MRAWPRAQVQLKRREKNNCVDKPAVPRSPAAARRCPNLRKFTRKRAGQQHTSSYRMATYCYVRMCAPLALSCVRASSTHLLDICESSVLRHHCGVQRMH
eukprot:220557-Pleurochrysis_carterae.AAC.1